MPPIIAQVQIVNSDGNTWRRGEVNTHFRHFSDTPESASPRSATDARWPDPDASQRQTQQTREARLLRGGKDSATENAKCRSVRRGVAATSRYCPAALPEHDPLCRRHPAVIRAGALGNVPMSLPETLFPLPRMMPSVSVEKMWAWRSWAGAVSIRFDTRLTQPSVSVTRCIAAIWWHRDFLSSPCLHPPPDTHARIVNRLPRSAKSYVMGCPCLAASPKAFYTNNG